MLTLTFTAVGFLVLTLAFYYISNNARSYSTRSFSEIFIGISAAGTFVSVLVLVINGYFYTAAGYKAEIINREYGTHYTQEEVFYAKDVIDTIQHINRTRVELTVKK